MTISLTRIDSAPINNNDFPFAFNSWVSVLVDTLNEVILDVQNAFNILQAPAYTSTEINDFFVAGDLSDGVLLYDNVLHVYVGMENGALVKFTTSAYP